MDESKYPREQLVWLAGRLRKGINNYGKADRKEVIREFGLRYPDSPGISPGKLAVIYREYGGNQASFIAKYDRPEDEAEAKRDGIIGQALLDWDARGASFANVWAFAAYALNEKLGTKYRGTQIEARVRGQGGVVEFLLDCGKDLAVARRAAERAREARFKR